MFNSILDKFLALQQQRTFFNINEIILTVQKKTVLVY